MSDRLRALDNRVLGRPGQPDERTVTRRAWGYVALMAVLLLASAFGSHVGIGLAVSAFGAGLWSGRLQEAKLAARGQGIVLDSPPLEPLGRVTWPAPPDS